MPKDDESLEPSFLHRHRFALGIGAVLLLSGTALAVKTFSGHSAPPRREAPLTLVSLLPPLPPPPPPPPQQKPPEMKPMEQKMIDQTPVHEPEAKPKAEPPKSAPAPGPVGTGIKGAGDGFGLGGGNGSGFLGGSGKGSGSGSRWGWYAGQVQGRIAEALRRNRTTRSAGLSLQVRVWPDSSGRITRAQLVGSSGDPAVDAAIQNEVLNGLQLQEPPPADMPKPIVLRLMARRPS